MKLNLAENLDIDIQTIMTGRGCIIGQSGSGKSYLVGVVAEELCKLNMPFCIVDTEGEYSSLKSMFNVLVVGGTYRDIDLSTDYAKLFASSIVNNVPVVLDVSDALDKKEAVYTALRALYQLEGKIKKPYLVLIEEGDKFAPQIISKGLNVIEEISVRGRKRGMGLLVATQRPANISKNVLSQCSYGFIGKLTIENDLNTIKILFENKDKLIRVTKLNVGEFISFGIGHEKTFKVKERVVEYIETTPSVEVQGLVNKKLGSIIRELKGNIGTIEAKRQKKAPRAVSIQAIPASFTAADAKARAIKMAKRKFILFGEITESIDPISLKYMPLGACTLRLPTKHKNEYLEYHTLVNERCELVELKRGVRFLPLEGNLKNTCKKGLRQGQFPSERVETENENLVKSGVNEKQVRRCLNKFLHDFILDEFAILHMPLYRITLREGNRVRIFNLDGVYGKDISI